MRNIGFGWEVPHVEIGSSCLSRDFYAGCSVKLHKLFEVLTLVQSFSRVRNSTYGLETEVTCDVLFDTLCLWMDTFLKAGLSLAVLVKKSFNTIFQHIRT